MVRAEKIHQRLADNQLPVVWLVARLRENGWDLTRQSLSNLLNNQTDGSRSQPMLKDADAILTRYEQAFVGRTDDG